VKTGDGPPLRFLERWAQQGARVTFMSAGLVYSAAVYKHPTRYYGTGHLYFLTCSCYHRQRWLASRSRRDLLVRVLEEVRRRYKFVVVSEPEKGDPSKVMQGVKQGLARRVLRRMRKRRQVGQATLFGAEPEHVWQRRFYDFNVWSERKRIKELRYMHRNPVARGLVGSPEQWAWNSFRAYACGEAGAVKLNQWPAPRVTMRKAAAWPSLRCSLTHCANVLVSPPLQRTQRWATRPAALSGQCK
jgi:putative transposase